MDIANIATPKTTLAVDARQNGLSLRVGQILTATVQAKLSNNLFDLVVNNQRLQARTDQALRTGQNLKLVVEKLDNPIVLRALPAENSPALEKQQYLQNIRTEWLKNSLPKPASLQPLLKQLNQLLQGQSGNLSKPVQQQFNQLLQQLPSPQQLFTKAGLSSAFKDSGLFYEAKLLTQLSAKPGSVNSPLPLLPDVKGQLLKLTELLKPTSPNTNQQTTNPAANTAHESIAKAPLPSLPQAGVSKSPLPVPQQAIRGENPANNQARGMDKPVVTKTLELMQVLDQAVNKIQLQQNQAISLDRSEALHWGTSIPVMEEQQLHLIDLNIYQDTHSHNSAQDPIWRIEIAMDLNELGPIQARLSLYAQQLSLVLFAEQSATMEKIAAHLDELSQDIISTGLDISDIRCVCGSMPQHQPNPNQNALIDLHL